MNYWVISPNARNDGNIKKYLNIIKKTHKVLMGWSETDNLGKTFRKNIKIGDLILIAQGSNKNKKVYFVGLVDSDAITEKLEIDNDIFEGQNRLLKYFTKLEDFEFDFENCTYGYSKQIPAIYKLKPNENKCDKELSKKLKEKVMITKERENLTKNINILKYQKQIILQGPPGTGKTRLAKQMANFIINGDTSPKISKNKDQVKLIQFHPSYSYEDFVRGIVAKANGTQIEYKAEDKILAQMAKEALDNPEKEYILIIDEINRANLSSVLGELIYALEYRDEAVESMYEVDNSKEIILPSNLYIIGTMNTADRSIGHIDYAIRRRFAFENILPNEDIVNPNSKFNEVKKIFEKHLSPEFDKEKDKVMLGHSYFIADNEEQLEEELENKLKYQVIPLLKEYVKDGVLNESALSEIDKLGN